MNIKKFLISLLLISFGLLVKNSSVWACPVGVGGCVEWTSSHVCNTAGLSNQCIFSGGDYWGMVKVAQNNCAGGAGCGPGRDCYWSPVWNGACGDCCWGGSDPQPTCTGVTISACVDEGGNYVAQADGVQDATSVKFPTWSLADGQDDLVWYSDSSGPPWSVTINQSNHTGGSIATHVYLNNNSYTNEWCGGATVAVPCILPAPENLATSCRNNGNTVDFSWSSVSGAASYVLRLNKDPSGDWMGPGDQWLTPSGTNETANISCGDHYTWTLQPVKPGESYPYSGLYAGSEFTCPCTTPKTWTITTEAVCTNGMTHSKSVTSWYRIWPPNPVQDTTLTSQVGPKIFSITSTDEVNNIYVGMYRGGWLELNSPPPHSAITYSDYWGGVPNAKWDRENLPEGNYRIEFQALPTWCPTPTPPPDPISFYLHEVSNADACTTATSPNSNPVGEIVSITESGTGAIIEFPVDIGSTTHIPDDETHNYSIPNLPSPWVCACSISGADQSNTCAARAYNETIQWSITEVASSWWQTQGGNVHVQSNINVDIPPGLLQQLSLSNNGAVGVITSGGAIGVDLDDTWKYPGTYFNFDDNPIDYEFFWLQAGGPNTANIFNPISQGSFGSESLYYGGKNTDMYLNNGNWTNVINNKQVIVFVDGNLTIPQLGSPLTLGPQKSFLAFIVSGNIIIETGHTPPDNDEIDLHGIFIADGDINIQGDIDKQFVGKGVFAAGVDRSGSVTFNRNLGIDNNLFPPVLFIWDPELVLNAPTILMQNYTSWHEVAPVGN